MLFGLRRKGASSAVSAVAGERSTSPDGHESPTAGRVVTHHVRRGRHHRSALIALPASLPPIADLELRRVVSPRADRRDCGPASGSGPPPDGRDARSGDRCLSRRREDRPGPRGALHGRGRRPRTASALDEAAALPTSSSAVALLRSQSRASPSSRSDTASPASRRSAKCTSGIVERHSGLHIAAQLMKRESTKRGAPGVVSPDAGLGQQERLPPATGLSSDTTRAGPTPSRRPGCAPRCGLSEADQEGVARDMDLLAPPPGGSSRPLRPRRRGASTSGPRSRHSPIPPAPQPSGR